MTATGEKQDGCREAEAIAKIAALLRSPDDRLAVLKHEASPGRLLTLPEGADALRPWFL